VIRVFSLIGLYPELEYEVDYSKSVKEAYTSLATHLVMREPNCLPTLLACAVWHRSQTTSWPAWVPDRRNRVPYNPVTDELDGFIAGNPELPWQSDGSVAVKGPSAETWTVASPYVSFVVGPGIPISSSDDHLVRPVITESGSLAFFSLQRHYNVLVGDLILDMDYLFAVRPTSSQYAKSRLVAQSRRANLLLMQPLVEIPKCTNNSGDQYPLSFNAVCRRIDSELSLLHKAFPEDQLGAIVARLLSARSDLCGYGDSPNFPRSQCLTVFDIA
jgi:hypothetical protein